MAFFALIEGDAKCTIVGFLASGNPCPRQVMFLSSHDTEDVRSWHFFISFTLIDVLAIRIAETTDTHEVDEFLTIDLIITHDADDDFIDLQDTLGGMFVFMHDRRIVRQHDESSTLFVESADIVVVSIVFGEEFVDSLVMCISFGADIAYGFVKEDDI